jgi:hypothetical protein
MNQQQKQQQNHPASPDQNDFASLEINPNSTPEPEELPEGFEPDAVNNRYAKQNGLDLEEELAAFGDIHRSHGNKRRNWQAVFHKYLKTAAILRGRIPLPDWMPVKEWGAYLAMRERIRRGATQYAQQLVVESLAKLREHGHEIAAILNRCTANNWTDVKRAASGMTTGSCTENMRAQVRTFDALEAFREEK